MSDGMSRRHAIGLLVSVLFAGRVRPAQAADPVREQSKVAADKGRRFLRELFDPALNLLPEFRGSKTYWLYHDNYLAAKVLQETDPAMARKIKAAIDGYGVRESGKIEIIFGEAKRPLPFRHYQLAEVRRLDGKVVKTETVTDQVMTGWQEYADLLLLAAVALAESDKSKARGHLQAAVRMWDGEGLKDRAAEAHSQYATYKLALTLLAASKLRERLPAQDAIRQRLLAAQAQSGGWITDYNAEGKSVGVANVETTSLAVLALDADLTQ